MSRVNQKPPKSRSAVNKKLDDSCQFPHTSVFSINTSWEAAVQERSSWSRRNTLKLDWSLLLITWTKKKPFWRKTLWSEETNTELSDHNEQQYVWRRGGEAFNSKNTKATVRHSAGSIMLWGCCAVSGSAALNTVNGIMTKEDYLKILQENLKSSAEDWLLGAVWCFNRTII